MKSSAAKTAPKTREVVPLFGPPPTVPTLVSLKWLCDVWMHGELKLMRLRTAMHADPNAPQPVCGDPRGGKYLYNGPQAVLWLESISKPGCWPKAEEAA